MRNAVIYLPGIGDHKPYFQPQLISLWRLFGVKAVYHPVIWRDNEPFEHKLEKITAHIDQLHANGKRVSLVGVSAGATAAFNAYMARPQKVASVVYVCGKLHRPESVGQIYYQKNPAFKESLIKVQSGISNLKAADTKKMLSLHPIYDETVPIQDTVLPSVRSKKMLAYWHIPSIFIGITFYGRTICKFVRAIYK
jgi:pimeloyl-ACP methyl ester carboxylesterase